LFVVNGKVRNMQQLDFRVENHEVGTRESTLGEQPGSLLPLRVRCPSATSVRAPGSSQIVIRIGDYDYLADIPSPDTCLLDGVVRRVACCFWGSAPVKRHVLDWLLSGEGR